MPTPSETKALAFLALVTLLGGAVRVLRADDPPAPSAIEERALAQQTAAAASAAERVEVRAGGRQPPRRGVRGRRGGRAYADTLAHDVGGVLSVPATFARPGQPNAHRPFGRGAPAPAPAASPLAAWGFPPPGPRVDVDLPSPRAGAPPALPLARPAIRPRPTADTVTGGAPPTLDLDTASEPEIDRLPRVGPALARRIVSHRDTFGPFGSLEALGRVRGIGPATLGRLAPLVTFSGRRGPPSSTPRE